MAKAPLEMARVWVRSAGGRGCAAHNMCMHARAYIVCYALHHALHMRNDKWVPGARRGALTTSDRAQQASAAQTRTGIEVSCYVCQPTASSLLVSIQVPVASLASHQWNDGSVPLASQTHVAEMQQNETRLHQSRFGLAGPQVCMYAHRHAGMQK
jgi:hypothetical protein